MNVILHLPNMPERGSVVMGSFDETLRVDGRWVPDAG